MSPETTEIHRQSTSWRWLIAAVPALLIIAVLLYVAFVDGVMDHRATPRKPAATTHDGGAPQSGK